MCLYSLEMPLMNDDLPLSNNPQHFLDTLRSKVGVEHVFGPDQVRVRYGSTTTGTELRAAGIIEPADIAQVQEVVRLASSLDVSLYPISTGNNWGYGGASPASPDSIILDLRRLTGIDDRNMDLGVIAVEPGVTQQMLRDYLDARGYAYMVPVHGGGPSCSLLGNALERGYGITPHTDHFGAVTALEAILPNGEYYRSPMSEQGGEGVDALFKWGVGPYLDGLFTQGGFGVVVRVHIVLAPRPGRIESFVFRIREDEHLPAVVEELRKLVQRLPGVVVGVNLMNARRMLSMMVPYPSTGLDADGVIDNDHIRQLAAEHRVTPWTGLGALYGEPGVVAAARKCVRAALRGLTTRPLFIQPATVQRMVNVSERLPEWLLPELRLYLRTLNKGLRVISGIPGEVALPLVFWKQGGVGARVGLDPARDGGGIIWYAPLVPLRADAVRQYLAMADRVCRRFGIEPLLTLTTQSDRCCDSTLPILFNPADESESQRARQCYRALLEEGRKLGFLPYRYPVHEMSALVDDSQPYWRLARALKSAADPRDIIAPGRYS